jgi:nitric-oxide synthase
VRIKRIREHNDNVRSYELEPIEKSVARSLAGQHIVIEGKIDGLWVSRCYTLTSIAEDQSHYEITVKREEQGLFSRWLFDHDREQIMLRVSIPQGEFFLEHETAAPALCFVAGIGVTPAIAFGRKLLAGNHKKHLHIDYSVRRRIDLAFHDELTDWPKRCPNVSVNVRVTSEQGRITEQDIRDLMSAHAGADAFICGPEAFESALRATLAKADMPPNKIFVEQFVNAGAPITSPDVLQATRTVGARHADST